MRLRRKVSKKAVALAVVAAVAVSVPASASAVEYEAKNGTVTVTKEEDSTKLSESSGTNAKSYQTDESKSSYDKDITIKGDSTSSDADTDKTIVDVKDNVSGANITIDGVKSETNNERSAAIEIGDNVNANVTIKNVEITLGKTGENESVANKQAGIRVGEGSDVTINVEGNNTIQGASSSTADDIVGSDKTAHKLLNGVVVGGGGEDGAGDGKGTKVEITSDSAEGGTLTIKDTITGITVHGNSTLTIGDDDDDDKDDKKVTVNVEDTHSTKERKASKSGDAIAAYGDLIVNNGATVDIDEFGRDGIETFSNLTVTDGATVTIDDHGEHTIHKNHDGIYHSGSNGDINITGAGTSVNVSTTTAKSIAGEGADINVTDGASLTVSGSTNAAVDTAAAMNIKNGASVTVKNSANGLYSHGSNGSINIDNANVTITDSTGNAISTEGGDITVQNKATVNADNIGNAGISLGGGAKLTVKDDGTIIDITKTQGDSGIHVGGNSIVNILSDAKVKISDSKNAHGINMEGSNAKVIVDDGTLEMDRQIVSQSSSEEQPNLLEVKNGGKVSTSRIWNYDANAKKLQVWVTGGTLTLTSDMYQSTTRLTSVQMQSLPELNTKKKVWPTNSPTNGDERLVNFKLKKDGLVDLINSLSDAEKSDVVYDADKQTLTIKAYTQELGTYDYVIDLNKYADGEDIDVWVPAVILDYYYPFESLDDLTEAGAKAATDKKRTGANGAEYDVIMRGHSIAFATLSDKYTTGITEDQYAGKTRNWYYYDTDANAWKTFTSTTPLKVYKLGNSLADSKPIVGIHSDVWSTDPDKREEIIPSDCRYHGLAGDPCIDPECDKLHTVVLPLEDHLWLNKDNISESGLTLTETENGGYVDADGNKYQIDENGNLWKITKEATTTEEGEMMLVCINYPDKVDAADAKKDFVPVVDEIITSEYAEKIKNGDVKVEYELSDNFTGDKETAHYQVKAIEKLKPVTPPDVPEKEKKDGDDDIVPVVPPVVPVVPTETTETTVPVVPVAETTTPVVPAEPVAPATPADTTPKLPQTGADWFSAIGMAAAGLALSIGSLFGKGKHEKE